MPVLSTSPPAASVALPWVSELPPDRAHDVPSSSLTVNMLSPSRLLGIAVLALSTSCSATTTARAASTHFADATCTDSQSRPRGRHRLPPAAWESGS